MYFVLFLQENLEVWLKKVSPVSKSSGNIKLNSFILFKRWLFDFWTLAYLGIMGLKRGKKICICFVWQSKYTKGRFMQFSEDQQQWFTLLGWAGVQYGQPFPQGQREDERPTLLPSPSGEQWPVPGELHPEHQVQSKLNLHCKCCCCRGFKSGNPNAILVVQWNTVKALKQEHSPSRDWINKSIFRQLCAIQHFASQEEESLSFFKPPHKSCHRFCRLVSEMGCLQS